MAKKKRAKLTAEEPDLTPMIDVVFLLLIFFMLITEITKAEIENVQLPSVQMAQPDENPPKDRLIINIAKLHPADKHDRRGVIKIHGRMVGTSNLVRILKAEADIERETEEPFASARYVLIRCDRRVQWRKFLEILTMCSDFNQGIRLYKIQIAIAKDEDD